MVAHDAQVRAGFLVMSHRYGVHHPSDVVWQRYQSWCTAEATPRSLIDRALVWSTSLGRFSAWLASSYAGRFHRQSALRRQEVALLAFLECDREAAAVVDTSRAGGAISAWLRFLWWGTSEALGLLLGLPFFAVLHLAGGKP
ncbi:MAG: hypothetical protein ACI97A_000976 [Planctomycetota bacterium]